MLGCIDKILKYILTRIDTAGRNIQTAQTFDARPDLIPLSAPGLFLPSPGLR